MLPASPFLYQPTRATQPYRQQNGQMPGAALSAMLAGRTMHGYNPMDLQRGTTQRQPLTPGQQRQFEGGLAALLLRLSSGQPILPR